MRTVNRRNEQQEVICCLRPWQLALKRAADVCLSSLGLIILSPLFALIIITLACGREGGGIFYSQERIGRGGRPFRILKFRTMHPDSEPDGPQLEKPGDERLTRAGAFLRAHHLDELPQLWNVLRGDMSLVGYRPERQYFIDRIMAADPRYRFLFQMRPGVTSEATLYNGYTDTLVKMLERLAMDLRYLETASLHGDLSILLRTVAAVI